MLFFKLAGTITLGSFLTGFILIALLMFDVIPFKPWFNIAYGAITLPVMMALTFVVGTVIYGIWYEI